MSAAATQFIFIFSSKLYDGDGDGSFTITANPQANENPNVPQMKGIKTDAVENCGSSKRDAINDDNPVMY